MRNKLKEVKKKVDDADRASKAAMTEAVSSNFSFNFFIIDKMKSADVHNTVVTTQ